MPQAGIHGLIGLATRKLPISREWLLLGLILGNVVPDLDAVLVAVATLSGGDTHGLHRTWSHSIITILGLIGIFQVLSIIRRSPRIGNLGLGLGLGMLMHSITDLFIWFRGVQLFWPWFPEINFWHNYSPPDWWYTRLEYSLEFGLIGLFLYVLLKLATSQDTDTEFIPRLKKWIGLELTLFVVFTILVFTWSGYFIIFGAAYIFSLHLLVFISIRMRQTLDHPIG